MLFMFPGQGSQTVGMGLAFVEAFPEARAVFEQVDEALGEPLSRLILEGPLEALSRTQNTQPALMCVSMAMVRVLELRFGLKLAERASYLAGHSLGELTALTAAGVLPLDQAARLLRLRGKTMQEAVPEGQGAMAAVLGLPLDAVEQMVEQIQQAHPGKVCEVANDNCPGQVVISGHAAAIESATVRAKELGAKRCILLNVSAPFHCSLMEPAQHAIEAALEDIPFTRPTVPVITNVSAQPQTDPQVLKDHFVTQIMGRVRWRESLLGAAGAGVRQAVEGGVGTVLSGLLRKTCPGVEPLSCNTPQTMEAFVKAYG